LQIYLIIHGLNICSLINASCSSDLTPGLCTGVSKYDRGSIPNIAPKSRKN